jgi:hypothetical protein
MTHEGDVPYVQCKMSLRAPKSVRKVNDQSLSFTIPAFKPRLNRNETSLQLSENKIFFAVCRMYI